MELCFLIEDKLSQLAFPTHKRKMVFTEEKVKNGLCFGEEDILNHGSEAIFQFSVVLALNRRTNTPYNTIG